MGESTIRGLEYLHFPPTYKIVRQTDVIMNGVIDRARFSPICLNMRVICGGGQLIEVARELLRT